MTVEDYLQDVFLLEDEDGAPFPEAVQMAYKEAIRLAWDAALHYRDNPTKCACGEPVMKLSKNRHFRGPITWCSHCAPGPI